ncbi:MAG: HD domain-containing protein [Lewinella sp.]|jgi:predicted metal-dependent HD superfamily phosphohydrolase|uniref:HD domain-containing protein n=1 Tax=Lewinella sp. TaxID=2004506 RepID=UPI003D6BD22E
MNNQTTDLQLRFQKDIHPYRVSSKQEALWWNEIVQHYGKPKRAYHNLDHLTVLFHWADRYQALLADPEIVYWAIWYHDIIYQARRRDNEEQSALLAENRLTEIGLTPAKITEVAAYIRATSQHLNVEATGDLAFFLDFDLAILGAPAQEYKQYAAAVRQEYQHVPGFLYRRGRKKVLRYFLDAPRLYRTEVMYELLEKPAKENLRQELGL